MKILHRIEEYEKKLPIITIGNFDGVHLGHQTVISRVIEVAKKHRTMSCAITFQNHPLQVLQPNRQISTICTLKHKIHLLEQMGIDTLVLLKFTKKFSEQSPEVFLNQLMNNLHFSHLILGHDATIGKDREGDRRKVEELSQTMQFEVEYLKPYSLEGTIVSSSKVRNLILDGNLPEAEKLLGRKYSIYSTVIKGRGDGNKLGYSTINLDVENLCLPPLGVYAAQLLHLDNRYDGIVYIGTSPTTRTDSNVQFEIHSFDFQEILLEENAEVILHKFIRPDKTFDSIEALKKQIQEDIKISKQILEHNLNN